MKKQTKVLATMSAAALLAVGFSAVGFAAGWDNSTGAWRYIDNDGEVVTDEWKSSNGQWFYLGDDGDMVTDSLIEDTSESKTRYYYVDANGARVTNTWKAVALDGSENTDLDAEYWWYYFGSDGKAYTTDADKDITKTRLKTINGLKYAFDDEGHMLYGWIDASSKDQQDDTTTAWIDSDYYFNGWNDGHAADGWLKLEVEKDNGDVKNYWFYFEDGKKTKDKKKKINGVYYSFDKDGHMLDDWSSFKDGTTPEDISGSTATADIVYLNGDGAQRKNKWVWAVPSEDQQNAGMVGKDYDDDEYSWWYFNKSGKLANTEVKKINGKWYAFDYAGRMQTGFVYADPNDKTFYGQFGTDEYERADFLNDKLAAKNGTTGGKLYFFSDDEEKDGSRKTGYQNLELSDDKYQFYFASKSGEAATGYVSKIKKFTKNGLVLKPSDDDSSNYVGVSAIWTKDDGYDLGSGDAILSNSKLASELANVTTTTENNKTVVTEEDGYVLVSSNGTIVKNKTKQKDENDHYYITDSNGFVRAYFDSEDAYNNEFEDAKGKQYYVDSAKTTAYNASYVQDNGLFDGTLYTK